MCESEKPCQEKPCKKAVRINEGGLAIVMLKQVQHDDSRMAFKFYVLLDGNRHRAAILRPGLFVRTQGRWAFFAIADGLDAACVDTD